MVNVKRLCRFIWGVFDGRPFHSHTVYMTQKRERPPVTVTLSREVLAVVDEIAAETNTARSLTVDALLRASGDVAKRLRKGGAVLGALALLGSSGCAVGASAGVPPFDVHISAQWTSDQTGVIAGAVADWSAVGAPITLDTSRAPCSGDPFCVYVSPVTDWTIMQGCGTEAVATGCQAPGKVLIDSSVSDGVLAHIATHEFGHTLGLVHVPQTDAVMYPTLDGSPTITAVDVAQLQEVLSE